MVRRLGFTLVSAANDGGTATVHWHDGEYNESNERARSRRRVCAILLGYPIVNGAMRALNCPIDHGFGREQDISCEKRIDHRGR
eukprot:SAG11_NODE_30_length_23132_cov_22.413277_16_plen_84_part_00